MAKMKETTTYSDGSTSTRIYDDYTGEIAGLIAIPLIIWKVLKEVYAATINVIVLLAAAMALALVVYLVRILSKRGLKYLFSLILLVLGLADLTVALGHAGYIPSEIAMYAEIIGRPLGMLDEIYLEYFSSAPLMYASFGASQVSDVLMALSAVVSLILPVMYLIPIRVNSSTRISFMHFLLMFLLVSGILQDASLVPSAAVRMGLMLAVGLGITDSCASPDSSCSVVESTATIIPFFWVFVAYAYMIAEGSDGTGMMVVNIVCLVFITYIAMKYAYRDFSGWIYLVLAVALAVILHPHVFKVGSGIGGQMILSMGIGVGISFAHGVRGAGRQTDVSSVHIIVAMMVAAFAFCNRLMEVQTLALLAFIVIIVGRLGSCSGGLKKGVLPLVMFGVSAALPVLYRYLNMDVNMHMFYLIPYFPYYEIISYAVKIAFLVLMIIMLGKKSSDRSWRHLIVIWTLYLMVKPDGVCLTELMSVVFMIMVAEVSVNENPEYRGCYRFSRLYYVLASVMALELIAFVVDAFRYRFLGFNMETVCSIISFLMVILALVRNLWTSDSSVILVLAASAVILNTFSMHVPPVAYLAVIWVIYNYVLDKYQSKLYW